MGTPKQRSLTTNSLYVFKFVGGCVVEQLNGSCRWKPIQYNEGSIRCPRVVSFYLKKRPNQIWNVYTKDNTTPNKLVVPDSCFECQTRRHHLSWAHLCPEAGSHRFEIRHRKMAPILRFTMRALGISSFWIGTVQCARVLQVSRGDRYRTLAKLH